MLRNYILIAVRNILKHKFFATINMAGLTVGMTACLFIFIYVKDELSYDRFHKDAENIYRIGLYGKMAGQEFNTTNSSYAVGPAMVAEIPGVVDVTRTWAASATVFKYEEKAFTEQKIFYADSNFLSFFTYTIIEGNDKALMEPSTVVLTDEMATKYFGTESAIGKLMTVGNENETYKVTAVVKKAPENSHFKFNALISLRSVDDQIYKGWTGNSMQTYVRKDAVTDATVINTKLEALVKKHVAPEIEQLGMSYDEFIKQGGRYSYVIYPMVDSHLRNQFKDDNEPSSDIKYVYIFIAVGIFIMLIACINFMNLSTARSAGRAKEVGLRKTLGSQKRQLIGQFLSESFIFSLSATVFALVLSYFLMPSFNLLAGKELSLSILADPVFVGGTVALVFVVGLLAGSYPALYLTSFNPVEVLKGKLKSGMKTKGVRSVLVIVQFSVSIFLIAATLVVFQQLSFMQSKNLGIDKSKVITVLNTRGLGESRKAFKEQLEQKTGIVNTSYTNNIFPGINNVNVFRIGGSNQDHLLASYYADWDHQKVMKFKVVKGRYFEREMATDSSNCLINESAVRELGWTMENSIGQEIINFAGQEPVKVKVIGIVEDFNYESLKNKVRPLIIQLVDVSRVLTVRYDGNAKDATATIGALWKQVAPGVPFEFTFMDEDFDSLFRAEMRMRDLFTIFSGLAIFIACLGLFALAAFLTEQRTKEIGIRKAMGATIPGLVLTLSKEFIILVVISFILAVIPAWYFMTQWLNDFAYRIDLNILVFVFAGSISLLVAALTIGYQAIKAAKSNPVNSLRYE